MAKILMVLTSHDKMGDTGHKTGFWLEEFAAPYYVFRDAGAEIVIASPAGGLPPLDPNSEVPEAQTPATERYNKDEAAQKALANSIKLETVNGSDFDGIFYPGGHGPLWDLANDSSSINLIKNADAKKQPLALVCHAPGALRNVTAADGTPYVKGRKLTGFSNSEEDAVKLTEVVPFLIESDFKEKGAHYSKGPDWQSYVVKDGSLITGQNPASSEETAKELLKLIG